MKKLALVLGSLLVVGSVASAKEVMPAPVAAPEVVVKVVEKPVVVYKEKEAAWRPNGEVKVSLRYEDFIEGHKASDNDKKQEGDISVDPLSDGLKEGDRIDSKWDGADGRVRLRTDVALNFTPKQKLDIRYQDWYGMNRDERGKDPHSLTRLTHTYTFDDLDKVKVQAQTRFESHKKMLRERVVFDFADYFFKNDYIKATALQLAPEYSYKWTRTDRYSNTLGLYANAEFELPYGVTFQAEFDDFFKYTRYNRTEVTESINDDLERFGGWGKTTKTGSVELTLAKNFELYKMDRHTLGLKLEGVYGTSWAWSRGNSSVIENGTIREELSNNSLKKERWGAYTAKFEPSLNYSYKATDFVTLSAKVGGEYINRNADRHSAQAWRWQPYAEVGFKTTF